MSEPETEETTVSIEAFMDMKEVSSKSGVGFHEEQDQAQHFVDYAKFRKYAPFKITDWITKGLADKVLDKELASKYGSLKVWGTYTIRKGKNAGKEAYFSATTLFTAIKKALKAKFYVAVREDAVLVIPEASFAKFKSSNQAKAGAIIAQLEDDFLFMYHRLEWKKAHPALVSPNAGAT